MKSNDCMVGRGFLGILPQWHLGYFIKKSPHFRTGF